MKAIDLLHEEYTSWLREHGRRSEKKILGNFRDIAEKFHNLNVKKDNKSIFIPIHVRFLVHSIVEWDLQQGITFHAGVVMLNFLLRKYPRAKIVLTSELIHAFKTYFCLRKGEGSLGGLVGSALWLICKCLQGASDKRSALMRLGESGLLQDFLREGELESQGEKAIAMLLYFINKHVDNRRQIAQILIVNESKFRQPQAIRYVLLALQEADVAKFDGNKNLQKSMGKLMARFMGMEQVPLYEKMRNIDLIAFAASKNRKLLPLFRIPQIIQAKLSSPTLPEEPMMAHLICLVSLLRSNPIEMGKILDLAVSTLTNNIASRRIFILMHDEITERQLIGIMSVLPSKLCRLLESDQEREAAMKLIVSLKRAVNRVGLGRIFWYCCKGLVQKVQECRQRMPQGEDLELFELFEILIHGDIQF